jgi:hypothetical protein
MDITGSGEEGGGAVGAEEREFGDLLEEPEPHLLGLELVGLGGDLMQPLAVASLHAASLSHEILANREVA